MRTVLSCAAAAFAASLRATALLLCLLADSAPAPAQEQTPPRAAGDLRIMFYNLENFFSPFADTLNPQKEFSESSQRRWTWNRFTKKANDIFKVIVAAGGDAPPDLIGVCEIENRFVLNRIIYETPLAKFPYGVVHHDSPDGRGIDVGLMYNRETFELVESKFFEVALPSGRTTREILLAKGVVNELDTLHVMVCHLPSKYGGAAASEGGRMAAADVLRRIAGGILAASPHASLVIMGDFNDTPDSRCIGEGLGASSNLAGHAPDSLYNLALPLHRAGAGSIKFQGRWELIDLFFVSGNLLNKDSPIYSLPASYRIFSPPFLLEPDEAYTGSKPRRTYNGFRYAGGVSDHLPTLIDVKKGF
ncbi:MAG: endonuclease/exonuclease/phosphatase family protein [Prevotellaceae bacterium]|jgi:predicted extracellular nuclease|nr:endonuclease/exonuclease/phosphatase family protein [Prevotellaceae bacterium]